MVSTSSDAPAELMDAREVAHVLGVSVRHVFRLRDLESMPPPVRLGGAVRWQRRTLQDWINNGCPAHSLKVRR